MGEVGIDHDLFLVKTENWYTENINEKINIDNKIPD